MALSASDISIIAQDLRAQKDPALLVEAILAALVARGENPFAWRDVKAILKENLPENEVREGERRFDRLTSKVGGGLYIMRDSSVLPTPAKTPRASKSEGLSWSPSFLAPDPDRESWYGVDAGLRRLALSSTKCFSSYSEGDKACSQCPLARFCQEASFAKLNELATLLDEQEESRLMALAQQASQAPASQAPASQAPASQAPASQAPASQAPASQAPASQAPASQAPASLLADLLSRGFDGRELVMPFRGVCSYCGEQVPATASVIQIKGRGMYHPDCAAKL